MKFVADESVDAPIFHQLRSLGFEVYAIAEVSPGIPDEQVLQTAASRESILLTQDKDFGELVYRLGKMHCGVVLIRLSGLRPLAKAELVSMNIQKHLHELPRTFTVIYKDHIKIRKPFF